MLKGNNPRFPWKPSTTMLTYRLTGTTEAFGVDHDEPHQSQPAPSQVTTAERERRRRSSLTMVSLEDGAALLTWAFWSG